MKQMFIAFHAYQAGGIGYGISPVRGSGAITQRAVSDSPVNCLKPMQRAA